MVGLLTILHMSPKSVVTQVLHPNFTSESL